jgi:hypothetical protein
VAVVHGSFTSPFFTCEPGADRSVSLSGRQPRREAAQGRVVAVLAHLL